MKHMYIIPISLVVGLVLEFGLKTTTFEVPPTPFGVTTTTHF